MQRALRLRGVFFFPGMSELQPILDLLTGQWPWISKLAIVVGTVRLVVKPVGRLIQRAVTSAAEAASLSIDPDDDTWIEAMLESRAYKISAFLLDWLVSVKLPAAGELFQPKLQTPSHP